jgi:hypothetical protein
MYLQDYSAYGYEGFVSSTLKMEAESSFIMLPIYQTPLIPEGNKLHSHSCELQILQYTCKFKIPAFPWKALIPLYINYT